MIGLIVSEVRPGHFAGFRCRDAEFNRLLDLADRLRDSCEATARQMDRLRALEAGAIALAATAWAGAALALLGTPGGAADPTWLVGVLAGLVFVPGLSAAILVWRLRLRQRRRRRRLQIESAGLHDVLRFLRRMAGRVAAAEGWAEPERARFDAQLAGCGRPVRAARPDDGALRGDDRRPAPARDRRPRSAPRSTASASFIELLQAANRASGYPSFPAA